MWFSWPEGTECPVTSGDVEVRVNDNGSRSCRPATNLLPGVSALDKQAGGNHYKDLPIQPVSYIHANDIGYFEGNVIKYVSRWRSKGGIPDLEKAKHYIELLIELELRKSSIT